MFRDSPGNPKPKFAESIPRAETKFAENIPRAYATGPFHPESRQLDGKMMFLTGAHY